MQGIMRKCISFFTDYKVILRLSWNVGPFPAVFAPGQYTKKLWGTKNNGCMYSHGKLWTGYKKNKRVNCIF